MAFDRMKTLVLIEKSINPMTDENIAKVAYYQAELYVNASAKIGMSFEKLLKMCTFNLSQLPVNEFRETVRCLIQEITTSSYTPRINTGEKVLPLSKGKVRLTKVSNSQR